MRSRAQNDILVSNDRAAKCWLASFAPGNPWLMPADEPLPLPFATGAGFGTVSLHLHRTFAGAAVVYQQR